MYSNLALQWAAPYNSVGGSGISDGGSGFVGAYTLLAHTTHTTPNTQGDAHVNTLIVIYKRLVDGRKGIYYIKSSVEMIE